MWQGVAVMRCHLRCKLLLWSVIKAAMPDCLVLSMTHDISFSLDCAHACDLWNSVFVYMHMHVWMSAQSASLFCSSMLANNVYVCACIMLIIPSCQSHKTCLCSFPANTGGDTLAWAILKAAYFSSWGMPVLCSNLPWTCWQRAGWDAASSPDHGAFLLWHGAPVSLFTTPTLILLTCCAFSGPGFRHLLDGSLLFLSMLVLHSF